jgi:hypothetical protein
LLPAIARVEDFVWLAERHGVVFQLSSAVELQDGARVAPQLAEALRQSRKNQVLSALSLSAELLRVLDLFEPAGLDAVAVKGPTLSLRTYGDSAARRYGDIDLLLRHSEIQRAGEILVAAGFVGSVSSRQMETGKTPGQYLFRRGDSGVLVELHTERTLRYFPQPVPIEDFLQRRITVALDNRPVPALALEDEFVLISIHGAKHFWERLMWIADIAAVVNRHPEIDWARVRKSAAAVGAERMVRLALFLATHFLRVPVPDEMKREVAADAACPRIAKKIETWLPYAGHEPPALAQRALFRLQMRGRVLAGARYLTRLSLSTTEEDWSSESEDSDESAAKSSSLRESLRRPFRLAKKYRRSPDS